MEPQSYERACKTLLDEGRFKETELLARKWIEASPRQLEPLLMIAFALQAQMKWSKLIEAGERYITLGDDLKSAGSGPLPAWQEKWKVLVFLGQAYIAQGDRLKAEKIFQQAVADSDDMGSCLKGIGKIYQSKRKYTESLGYFQKAMACRPEDRDIIYTVAQLFGRIGDREGRLKSLKKIFSSDALELFDFLEIMDIEIEKREWKQAEATLGKAIAQYPDHTEVLLRGGAIFRKLKDYDRAGEFLRRASAATPREPKAAALLSLVFADQGRFAEAERLIREFQGNEVNLVPVHLAASCLMWLDGSAEDSLDALDRICKILHIGFGRRFSSVEGLFGALQELAVELGHRLGPVEEQIASEVAATIQEGSGTPTDAIKIETAELDQSTDKAESKEQSVSLCMIVKDEESCLEQCLANVSPLVDQMVIVDTGSGDRTPEIARSFGAEVYHFRWVDDYAKARNFSIRQATGEWILIMDADEVIAERDLPKIKDLLENEHLDGYRFILRNYENNRMLANIVLNPDDYAEGEAYFGFIPARLIRLFRRDRMVFFRGAVHETLDYSFERSGLIAANTDIPIHHYGKVLDSFHLEIRKKRKNELYMRLGEKRLRDSPDDVSAVKGLADQYLESGMYREAQALLESKLGLASQEPELHYNMARALEGMNLNEKAVEEYAATLARSPGHIGASNNLAVLYSRHGNSLQAVEILQEAIRKGRRHPVIYYTLGNIYKNAGDYGKALQAYRKTLQIDPEFPGTNEQIREVLARRREPKYPEGFMNYGGKDG